MNKAEIMTKKHDKKYPLVPRLRFPEFHNAGEWEQKKLGDICTRILQKVTDDSLVPVSISAGQGFVSQESKFGRNISGAQYKNYIFLKYGDFAYNRGNSKKFPQGYVCQLKEFEQAAASSAFICFRFTGKYQATFFQSLFDNNIHGKQLIKHITSSARSDGLLNIRPDVFFSILLPVPHLYSEQQRIADCLSSLDERISAETSKLERLKEHKKGLMQQLFPAEGERLPRLRFPEFRNAGEWKKSSIKDVGLLKNGYAFKSQNYVEKGKYKIITIANVKSGKFDIDNVNKISQLPNDIQAHQILKVGDILISMTGNVGRVCRVDRENCLLNQRVGKIVPAQIHDMFLYHSLQQESFLQSMTLQAAGGAQGNLSISAIQDHKIQVPEQIEEQQRIAYCLSSLDKLITAQTQKIDLLKDHKKGLMQQLFPRMDEVLA